MDTSSLAVLETDKREYENQLEMVKTSIAEGSGNLDELQTLADELQEIINLTKESIAALKPTAAAAAATSPHPSPAAGEKKWSRDNSKNSAGASNDQATDAEPEQLVRYNVNDDVMAKWVSGDKSFYQARITSVTGSSTDPVYTVKFSKYNNVETLRSKDIRPMPGSTTAATAPTTATTTSSGIKRKADDEPAATTTHFSPVPGSHQGGGLVAQAAAEKYPVDAGNQAGEENDKPKPKFKKIKATKELEGAKNKWQEFNAKGKFAKKAGGAMGKKKDSMFRTPEGVHGRVGFTGSGQSMRKDVTRTRHVYNQTNEDDD